MFSKLVKAAGKVVAAPLVLAAGAVMTGAEAVADIVEKIVED